VPPGAYVSSVAKQILAKLATRLAAIDGTGAMLNDLSGRVFRRRPVYDVDNEPMPAVFITRRGGGDTRTVSSTGSPRRTLSQIEIVFDIVGIVELGEHSGDAAEDLLADIERAIELETDAFIGAAAAGERPTLLSQELSLVGAQIDPPPPGSNVELIAVGVRCVFPHKYGDPDHVQP
jgi:hypothetical protein